MFTQFFGNYLLNRGLVSKEQLSAALEAQKSTRLKLGVLAINAGLMTAEQVETAHTMQQREDKRIGDVMVELGFVTKEQVEELFKTQPSGHLLLGQALVDSKAMTNADFEKALNDYKAEYSVSDEDLKNEDESSVKRVMANFYNFDKDKEKLLSEYVYLLYKNVIRFIGGDFTPAQAEPVKTEIKGVIRQDINGKTSVITAISADREPMINFASRFAKEELTDIDEYTRACIGEFINLHNGLFTVNISNDTGEELSLTPQEYDCTLEGNSLVNAIAVPLVFPFGTVKFIVA